MRIYPLPHTLFGQSYEKKCVTTKKVVNLHYKKFNLYYKE